MPDTKLADMTATTSLAATDIFYTVVDPGGTPLDRKVTFANLFANAWPLDHTGAAASTDALTLDVTGDTQLRFVVNHDGSLEWGSGAAAADVTLYRSAANTLKTNDNFAMELNSNASTSIAITNTTDGTAARAQMTFNGASSKVGLVAMLPAAFTDASSWANRMVMATDIAGGVTINPFTSGATVRIDVGGIGGNQYIFAATTLTVAEAVNVVVGTTTGTKIGTATTQKIGFYNATPVVQGASIADPGSPGAIYAQAEAVAIRDAVVSLITRLEATGLIATV